ncbi:hypothetical protein LC087_15700 [Bacillus carboniphilus]|uniref:Uncharacterized protein n=1 Tax=Bacillus carboniphilus TaxID=86663 RepID=A0ABY9JWW5_9BACI|nr:hypothetical protein [Bacillus carboniphilus]WLR42166.1 hypothetical protein LC087_15700 [Bacillus carboniphilus]
MILKIEPYDEEEYEDIELKEVVQKVLRWPGWPSIIVSHRTWLYLDDVH